MRKTITYHPDDLLDFMLIYNVNIRMSRDRDMFWAEHRYGLDEESDKPERTQLYGSIEEALAEAMTSSGFKPKRPMLSEAPEPEQPETAQVDLIDEVAQFIRKINGNNDMGAGQIAEHLAANSYLSKPSMEICACGDEMHVSNMMCVNCQAAAFCKPAPLDAERAAALESMPTIDKNGCFGIFITHQWLSVHMKTIRAALTTPDPRLVLAVEALVEISDKAYTIDMSRHLAKSVLETIQKGELR